MNKRNTVLIITGTIILVIAFVLFIIGGLLAQWDFIAFFKSNTFIWICLLFGIYAVLVGIVLIYSWYHKL